MGQLKTFLEAEGQALRRDAERRKQKLDAWRESLGRLMGSLRGWLAASDPDKLLEVTPRTVTVREPSLGEYAAPSLQVALGPRLIDIAPRGRQVAATVRPAGSDQEVRAQGLVEMREPGGLDYYLFLVPENGSDRWFLQSVAKWNLDETRREVHPLDAERFESAIVSMLR